MNRLLLLLLLSLIWSGVNAQQNTKWSRVTIYTDDRGLNQLSQAGVTIDHGEYRRGYSFTTDLSSEEIARVRDLGFTYEIIIDDVQQYYVDRNSSGERQSQDIPSVQSGCGTPPSLVTPSNFTLGSMGGFFTLSEIYWHLDNMANLYPTLVKPRVPIDSNTTTFEGRYVYWLKISDNASTDENEPEMLYTAAHHAREPAGISQLILYMYYLLENYNTNPEIQYIVNNTELYFVPCVNPDGYWYNENTSPSGGGMWRKNRIDHQNGDYGTDLNRNYSYNWGYDNNGSSPNTFDDTYRGPTPASEAETQLVQQLCNAHQFRIAINYHTYSNLLICPWGYAPSTFTPDSSTFNAWGPFLTEENGYAFGTPDQTVGYTANGSSDDWMYGDQMAKPKIFAMTPEAGDPADGFWPAQNRIIDICLLNVPMDLKAARLLLAYAEVEATDGRFVSTPNSQVHFNIQRLGLDSPAVYTVSVQPLSAAITSTGSAVSFSSLSLLQQETDSIALNINPSTPVGTMISYVLELNNGTYTWRDTVNRIYGTPVTLLASNGNSISNFQVSGGWNITSNDFWTGPSSLTDSPNGDYSANANTWIRTAQPVNLGTAVTAQLSFYTKFQLEASYDYGQVQVSTDNGSTWTALCGRYTTNNNNLDNGNPCYSGFQNDWVKEEMSLDDYLGQSILIRFRVRSDFFVEYDGWYLDEILVEALDTSASSIHESMQPEIAGENIPNPAGDFTMIPLASHPDGYLEIFNAVGELVMSVSAPAGENSVIVPVASLPGGVYLYRFRSDAVVSGSRRMIIAH